MANPLGMVLITGFEPVTSILPRWYTTSVLYQRTGSGGENRTPIMGFGDPYNAIILHRICMAVSVGFEPTERYKRPTA